MGTLGAAFAAFWSVIHSINVQRKRDDLEDEARKPRLEVKLVTPERERDDRFTAQHRFSFINLSQQAIYIGYVYKFDVASNDYSTISMLSSVDFDVLIPAFMIGHSPIVKAASPVEAGDYEYFFYFNCASTGPLFYRLRLPLKVRQYNIKMIEFNMSKQYVEGPVEPPPGFSKFAMSVPDADNQ